MKIMNSLVNILCLCSHDLDNIVLENLGDARTLVAVFELEALVLTGTFLCYMYVVKFILLIGC